MVGVFASVNLPLHHEVQKFPSATGSPSWSRKKGRKMVVVVVLLDVHFYVSVESWTACLSGCELKGRVVSSLEPSGCFTLLLSDDAHSDDIYNKLQQALKFVVPNYH